MNIAVIVAGGVGCRMGLSIPKQFVEVNNKPILIYTLENFQNNDDIDAIEVVCVEGWEDKLAEYVKEYKITKVKWLITGGGSVQESIRKGIVNLKGHCADDDIIIIHDGIRPLVDSIVLTNVIEICNKYGNAVSSLPYNEQIFIKKDEISTGEYIPREKLARVMTPQAYRFKKLFDCYETAFEKEIGIYGSSYTNTMMVELGETLYFAEGSDKNIKLTTPADLELFRAYIRMEDK